MSDERRRPRFESVWREARGLIRAHRGRLAVGFALMVFGRAAGLVLPLSSKVLIDDVIGKGRADLLGAIAAAVLAATVVQVGTGFGLSQLLGVAAQRAITEMRKVVEQHVARLPIAYFDSTKSGVLISRIMSDAEGVRNLVGTGLVQLAGGLMTAMFALAVMLYLNWRLTVTVLLLLGLFGGAMILAFRKLRPLFRERGEINAQVTGRLSETLSGIRVVKAYTAERREDYVFAAGAHRLFRNIAKSVTAISGVSAFATLVVGVVGVVMILMGGRAVLGGAMTIGGLVSFVVLTGLVASPLIEIASIGTQITEAFAGLDRIREIRQMTTEEEADRDREPVPGLRGAFTFQDVSFEYVAGIPVLERIGFDAAAGSTTALVGSSGSGKSTLISLVAAFNRPQSGRILVDGRDLSRLRAREYRRHIGVVLQENFLFDGTVAENIRFGAPHASMDAVRRAAAVSHCDEFIERLPQQYETVVGERGIKLSGGQRQRVAIARAILADPRILILDEATSSLDSEVEAKIQDALRVLRRGRTTFVIAHRLSTIRRADQILVLESGAIVERGTHDQLLALGGRYRELYDRQYQVEQDVFVNPGEDFTPDNEAVRSEK